MAISPIGSAFASWMGQSAGNALFKSINAGVTERASATRQGPLKNVDPKKFVGTWNGNWGKEGKFSVKVLSVTGYEAQVVYENRGMLKASTVLIRDDAIKIGDMKIMMDGSNKALAAVVFVDPANGTQTTVKAPAFRKA